MKREHCEKTAELLRKLGFKSAKVQRPAASETKKGSGRLWRVSLSGEDAFRLVDLLGSSAQLHQRAARPWYRRIFNP